ncbi:MAG: hypothetical protein ACYCT1_08550 [Steroidobacteraceae bacterium]
MADVRDGLPLPPAQAIRHALEMLSRASGDWRGNGSVDAGPLHWPVAVNLARRQLAQALEALEQRRVVQLRTALADWLCGHCGGSGFEEEDPCAFCGAAGHDAALDTADARAGIAWWNSLTPTRRREWLEVAQSPRPADAWRAFQAEGA